MNKKPTFNALAFLNDPNNADKKLKVFSEVESAFKPVGSLSGEVLVDLTLDDKYTNTNAIYIRGSQILHEDSYKI